MADDLRELDPSPVEDTPQPAADESSSSDYFPGNKDGTISPATFSSASRVGLSGHSAFWYLHRVQKYSSYTFSIFATIHFTSTALVPLITRSLPASEPYLKLLRPAYQSPWPLPLEPLLVFAPAAAHVTAGLALRLLHRRSAVRRAGAESRHDKASVPWPAVSFVSKLGYGLLAWSSLHVFTNRAWPVLAGESGSAAAGVDVNLGFVSHVFARSKAYAVPAYAFLIAAATGHFVWGGAKWMGWLPGQVRRTGGQVEVRERRRRWYWVNGAWAALAAVWYGGLVVVARGGEARGWVGKGYDALLKSMPGLWRLF